jgi:A/G-specific adenine glycosylase
VSTRARAAARNTGSAAHAERAGVLLRWYAGAARPLPWRATRDPYALLVSEVMLQQTQVARVLARYEAWLARFPDAAALAAAPAADVLRAWSGLGYNRRALALQAAARVVARDGWPADLRALPGVGDYTAAAVASFAWDRPVAAVDTNVRRVIGRWDGAPARPPRRLAARAQELLPAGRAATWNQAMMELGATVCTARAPRCGSCPVAPWCRSAGAAAVAQPGWAAPRRTRERFEDTDRWARGRLVAALVAGIPEPPLELRRRERAVAGLERDGLIVVAPGGRLQLPP